MATTTSPTKRSKKKRINLTAGPGGTWSHEAPKRIRETYQGDAQADGWATWRKHLAKRKVRPLAKRFPGHQSPLLWALPQGQDIEPALRYIELLRRPESAERETAGLESAVHTWLSGVEVAQPDAAFALTALAWATALPTLAEFLSERAWWQLCNRLIQIANNEMATTDPLAVQMLHAELPVLLLYALPELEACQELADLAERTLEQASVEPLDATALVHGSRLDQVRPLFACWTRTRILSRSIDAKLWSDESLQQYSRLVEYALRLSRADGRPVLAGEQVPRWNKRFLRSAVRLAERGKATRIANLLHEGGKSGDSSRTPSSSFQLEAACLAVMRCDWQRRSPQLAVNYSQPTLASELSIGRQLVWSGGHDIEIRFNDKQLTGDSAWDQICWESDHDVDYLELELDLQGGVRVQRHIALAREDRFLFIADAVFGTQPGKIEYRATLPLCHGVTFQGEQETREGLLLAGKSSLRVLPLELGEWRCGPARGGLQAANGQLELSQHSSGQCLFAPLFIDLNPRRLSKEVTWRQLTVGKNRLAVPRDEAVGYRVQVGRQQWLFYRALGGSATRTVLGKNLYNELLIGRFDADGKVQTLVEIEA